MYNIHHKRARLAAAVLAALMLLSVSAPALAEVFSAIVTAGSMTVYEDSKLSKSMDKLDKGAVVQVLAYSGKAAKIRYDGQTGYAKVSSMKAVDDVAAKAVVNASAKVYESASTASKSAKVKQGTRVYVLSWDDEWARVEKDGVVGYIAVDRLTKANDDWSTGTPAPAATPAPSSKSAKVTAKKLTVYKRQSSSSDKLGTLKKGQIVNVVEWDSKWAYIELDGNYGYCSVKGLARAEDVPTTPEPTEAPITTRAAAKSSLTVYKTASKKASKLMTLPEGTVVSVLNQNDSWAYIEYGGQTGFCPLSGLKAVDPSATVSPTALPDLDTAVKATVTAESVAVYREKDTSSTLIGTLMWGEEVNALSISGGWAYIEKGGVYGYCRSKALTKIKADPEELPKGYTKGGFKATVVYSGARAYESASTGADSVAVKLGTTLTVVGYSKDLAWACVSNGGARAFMPVKHLSRSDYQTVDSDGSAARTLQQGLLTAGYFDGLPSTTYNSMTTEAVKRFQAACGLTQNGVADAALQRILFSEYAPTSPLLSKTIQTGDSGADVKRVQTRLYVLGYLGKAASVDGSFGDTSAGAVGLFQKTAGLDVTGVADPATLKALYNVGAPSRPSGTKPADEGGSSGNVVDPSGIVKLSATYVTEMPAQLKSTTSSYDSSMRNALKLEHAIYSAQVKLGKTYVYGATGPNTFDCSGLTQYSFKQIDVSLKRSAYSQGYDTAYDKISSVGSLKRGDLVFFNTISDSDLSDHVGIYLGGGCFIHASSGGHKVVVSNLTSGYYNRVFSWGRRILK